MEECCQTRAGALLLPPQGWTLTWPGAVRAAGARALGTTERVWGAPPRPGGRCD